MILKVPESIDNFLALRYNHAVFSLLSFGRTFQFTEARMPQSTVESRHLTNVDNVEARFVVPNTSHSLLTL